MPEKVQDRSSYFRIQVSMLRFVGLPLNGNTSFLYWFYSSLSMVIVISYPFVQLASIMNVEDINQFLDIAIHQTALYASMYV